MKTKTEIEQLLKNTPEPSPALKEQILQRTAEITPMPQSAQQAKAPVRLRPLIAVAAAVMLLLIGTLGTAAFYFEDYESVYIDTNPSVELVLNRFDRIHKVICHNDDAAAIINPRELCGKRAEDGVTVVLDALEQNGYLEKEAEVCISTSSKEQIQAQKRLKQVTKRAEKYASENGCDANISGSTVTREEVSQAREQGLSVAQSTIIKEILEFDPTQDRELLEQMSVKELKVYFKLLQRDIKRNE